MTDLSDQLKIFIGVAGTSISAVLQNVETYTAIFAGGATGIFMVVATVKKLQGKD